MNSKNKIIKLGLSTFAALMLVACGSGGGSSDNSNENIAPINPSSPNTSSNQSSSSNSSSQGNNGSSSSSNKTGAALVISGLDTANVKSQDLKEFSTTKLNVDGKELTIGYNGIIAGSWTHINNTHVCCSTYSDTRIGLISSTNEKESDYVFYNGNPTSSIPTSGSATYKGKAIVIGDTAQFEDSDWLDGSSELTANFSDKTLKGKLTVDTLSAINVDAKISGNGFDGNAKSETFKSEGKVEGKFYGSNAKELGGLIKSNDWAAAFAGNKQ